jgi:hypothetical protein
MTTYIREPIPYGDQRPCQAPTARAAWAAVTAFCRDTVHPRDVLPTAAGIIRDLCGGRSWTATTPADWSLLLRRFGGGA